MISTHFLKGAAEVLTRDLQSCTPWKEVGGWEARTASGLAGGLLCLYTVDDAWSVIGSLRKKERRNVCPEGKRQRLYRGFSGLPTHLP